MIPRLRKPFSPASFLCRRHRGCRLYTSNHPQSSLGESTKAQARISKILAGVPRPLRRYTDGLLKAPVSHVAAFLILHELTAVVPLIGLATAFHYTNWLPPYISDNTYISSSITKFGSYFKRKGWFGFNEESDLDETKSIAEDEEKTKSWQVSDSSSGILIEIATAYTITKILLPARIVLSVWATPWFARFVIGKVGGGVESIWKKSGLRKGA